MNNRANYYDIEKLCQHYFDKIGTAYHLCTPENHPIIFRNSEDFKRGMSIMGIIAKAHRKVQILTFELMNNHLHVIIIGSPEDIEEFFRCLKSTLEKNLYTDGTRLDLKGLTMQLYETTSLENLRNVIAYTNRNGSVVDRHVSPYTYPWGANKYFFNTEAKCRFEERKRKITVREKRLLTKSHKYDSVKDLYMVDGYVCPLSFCDVTYAENLFRDTRHYFTKVSRHIESYDEIAKMIGEQIYYTDDDLYSILCSWAAKKYDCKVPSQLQKDQKLEMARMLRWEYNADIKKIGRLLKMDIAVLAALFGNATQ